MGLLPPVGDSISNKASLLMDRLLGSKRCRPRLWNMRSLRSSMPLRSQVGDRSMGADVDSDGDSVRPPLRYLARIGLVGPGMPGMPATGDAAGERRGRGLDVDDPYRASSKSRTGRGRGVDVGAPYKASSMSRTGRGRDDGLLSSAVADGGVVGFFFFFLMSLKRL